MADRSFKEYVANRFYDELFAAVKNCIEEDCDSLNLYSRNVKNIDHAELSDITVKMVSVGDLPGMRILFDVIVDGEIEVSETNRHYDNDDLINRHFIIRCTGDLEKHLDDFEVVSTEPGDEKRRHSQPLSDSLVPILYSEKADEAATDFLTRNYKEGLTAENGVDVAELVKAMGLKVELRHLSQDSTVFGQICFADCECEVYDDNGNSVTEKFSERTILVDPDIYFLRNLGAANNTIVHECVHWDRHRKAFMLERLYNKDATQIKCMVVGGIKNTSVRSANDWMEWQANILAPRIQMPLTAFKVKAHELTRRYREELNTFELVDIMEPVIDGLAAHFGVSRQAAKIRMIDAGYHEAIGAFTYIDGRYVRPHRFRKDAIKKSQTFCISLEDAIFIDFSDQELYAQSKKGAYVYVDSHVCLNSPKYVEQTPDGSLAMTEYGRLHIDECCLAFDLKVKSKNKYAEEFYKECVLFRDINSGIEFETTFSAELNGNLMKQAEAMLAMDKGIREILHTIEPLSFNESLKTVMEWVEITEEKLAEDALLTVKMIQRMRTARDYPKSVEPLVAVCIAMHLPPEISFALVDKAGFKFRVADNPAHLFYDFFLRKFYMYSVEYCNSILETKGLKPIATYSCALEEE